MFFKKKSSNVIRIGLKNGFYRSKKNPNPQPIEVKEEKKIEKKVKEVVKTPKPKKETNEEEKTNE